eukprot:scaffold316652_cov37-Tisochrysis_lutea.AAC.2
MLYVDAITTHAHNAPESRRGSSASFARPPQRDHWREQPLGDSPPWCSCHWVGRAAGMCESKVNSTENTHYCDLGMREVQRDFDW